jgi:DNA-binding NarL/FixJ family response regulator/tetratricopeptide (TPR) repeat protein
MGATLVGREQEVAAALESLELLTAGTGALAIEGEAGIGKSALWQLAVGAARERGLRVLEARPSEAERTLSYAALGDLLRPELAALEGLPLPQRRALEVALLLADPDGAAPDRRAIAVATLGALHALSASQPVGLAIDDVQWLDADSARALTFALRRLDAEPLLALLARRSDRPAPLPLGLDAWDDMRVLRVRLAPLGPTDMHALLAERLGLRLARPLLLRVHAAAAGNPLYGLELGRALMRHEGRLAPTAALPEPETLEGVVGERLGALSPEAQMALAAVAALADPRPAIVGAIAADGLDEALESGALQLEDERLRLAHPLFGSVVTSRLRLDRRRLLHRRLADLVDDFEQRALHVALAAEAPDRDAAQVVAEAARRAGARGAPDAALQLVEHALRLAPPEPTSERAALALEGSDLAFAAGDTGRAERLLRDALELAEPAQRASVLVRLSMLATYDGSILDARGLAEQALREAGDDPAARVVILRRLALTHLLRAELREAELRAASAARLAEATEPREWGARALANLACIQALRGRWAEASPAIERALAREGAPGVASIDDSPSAVAGLLLMYQGELAAGRARLRHALAQAQAAGGDPLSTGLLFALSELESRAGRFHDARELAIRGLTASEQTEQRTERTVLLFVRALAEAHLGAGDGGRAAAEEGLAIAERAEHRFAAAQNRWALGHGALSAGQAEEAWAALGPVVVMLREGEVGELGVVPVHADAIDALLMLGDLEQARVLVAELDAAARWPWLRAAAARCRGLLLAAQGDTDAALHELAGAVEAHRALDMPFALARTELALGSAQRRAKQRAAARQSLATAEAAFEALGAARWAERARAEAARLAGRRPSDDAGLTPTERGVAELAAAGRSNREIAGELFVSERTVEANLTRVYRKLGVRSRTELARRLP